MAVISTIQQLKLTSYYMESTKKHKLDIKGKTAKEPVKKQKPAVTKSDIHEFQFLQHLSLS